MTSGYLLLACVWLVPPLLLALAIRDLIAARRMRRVQRAQQQEIEALRAESIQCSVADQQQRKAIRGLVAELHRIGERQGQLELRSDGRAYSQAIAMVAGGADADKLVSDFRLSRGEARLMTLLHG